MYISTKVEPDAVQRYNIQCNITKNGQYLGNPDPLEYLLAEVIDNRLENQHRASAAENVQGLAGE